MVNCLNTKRGEDKKGFVTLEVSKIIRRPYSKISEQGAIVA